MNSRPLCIVAGVKATAQNQKACTQSDGGGLHATPGELYWDFV